MRIACFAGFVVGVLALAWAAESRPGSAPGSSAAGAIGDIPVLVELFTSEGCSSCPPADTFLQKLDGQPLPGAEMIVLSEHVDYWNHIGWKDPYSAHFYSDRQSAYASRFDLDSPYTPQMVVDGSSEFVGSDADLARKAFERALKAQKIPVRLSMISLGPGDLLTAHVDAGVVPSDAEVVVAVALNRAQSHVLHGENGGRTLTHAAVARTMIKVGTMRPGQGFAQDVQVKLEPGLVREDLRVIAFIQEVHQGKVLGATVERVPSHSTTEHRKSVPSKG